MIEKNPYSLTMLFAHIRIMSTLSPHADGSGLRGTEKGIWDSIHVVEVLPEGNKAVYKLTTTIMLSLQTKDSSLDLSGSVQKQVCFVCV